MKVWDDEKFIRLSAPRANAQTLWLAARIENRLGNRQAAITLGDQLRARFPQSPEATAYERRQFNE